MNTQLSKHQTICGTLINFMENKGKWEDSMIKEIPKTFEKYGGHLLFFKPAFANSNWNDTGDDLWKLVCKLYNGKAVAIGGRIQNDNYRTPRVQLLYGDTTMVNFIDNHLKYTWDIEENMFCAGNVAERHRIGKLNCEGEVIVDLFAGIGYFTLPYLVHAKAKFVHACEWNPTAVTALRRNLEINAVSERCEIHEGDNRMFAPKKVANRVNLGIIPSSEDYWQIACESLLENGGILYVHQNVTSKFNNNTLCDICTNFIRRFDIDQNEKCQLSFQCCLENNIFVWNEIKGNFLKCKRIEWFFFAIHIIHSMVTILNRLYSNIWKVSITEIFKVKSYAPHIDHIVFTVHCFPTE